MIELKFYRDDEYVYINNPDGTTKRVAIEDFEAIFDVDTAELPAYTSSDAGKVLVVNSDGTGLEWGEASSLAVVGYMIAAIDEQNPVTISPTSSSEVTLDSIGYFTDMSFSVELQNHPEYSDWSLVGFKSPNRLNLVSIIPPMIDDSTGEVSPPAMLLYNGGSSSISVSTDCNAIYLLLNRE